MIYNDLPDVEPRKSRGSSSSIKPEDVAAEAESQGVDPVLAVSVAKQESRGKTNAVSPKGAQGTMQLMPGTGQQMARKMGERYNPRDAKQNVRLGVAYLKEQLDEFDGDYPKALGAYNAGPGRVRQAGGVPKIKETQDYVRKIRNSYEQMADQLPDLHDDEPKPTPTKTATPAPKQHDAMTDYSSGLPDVVLPVKKVVLPNAPTSKPVNQQTGKPASQTAKQPASYQPGGNQEAAVLARAKMINAVGKLRQQAPAYGKALDGLQRDIEAAFSDVQQAPGTADLPSVVKGLSDKINSTVKTINTDQARRRQIQLRRQQQQAAAQQQSRAQNELPPVPGPTKQQDNPWLAKMNALTPTNPVTDVLNAEQDRKARIDAELRKPINLGNDPKAMVDPRDYKNGQTYKLPSKRELDQLAQQKMAEASSADATEIANRSADIARVNESGQSPLANLATRFARGATEATLDIPEGVATMAGASIPKPDVNLAPQLRDFLKGAPARLREGLTKDLGLDAVRDWSRRNLQGDQSRTQGAEGFLGKVAEGAGSVVPFALGTMLTRGGSLSAAYLGALQNAASTYRDAKENGASDDAAFGASRIGALIGVSESIGLPQSLERIGLARPLIQRAMEIGEEGGQEALSQWLNNINAAVLTAYDPKRGLMEDVLESGVIGAIIGGGTQGFDLATTHNVYGAIKEKVFGTGPQVAPDAGPSVMEAVIEMTKNALRRPEVQQAAQSASTAQGQVEQLVSTIAEDQQRLKRGEVPVNANAPVQLQEAQVQAAVAQQQLDQVVTNSLEPATKDISQLSPVQRLAALTSEQIKSGKTMTPIPENATIDQVKEIYRQRVQDFGTDSVAAAEAWAKVRELSPEVQLQAGKDRFYSMPDADALLNRLGNDIGTPQGLKQIDAFIRKNKIVGLTAEDIAGDYLTKGEAEKSDLQHEFSKMGLPTEGVVTGGDVQRVEAENPSRPDTGGRIINLEADLEAERQRIAAIAEGKRKADQQEQQMLAELEQRAKERAEAKATADQAEKIRIAEQEKAEKEAQKLKAKEDEAQRIKDERETAQRESQSLIDEHRQRYTDALGQNDYATAQRSLKQIEAQIKFQLREKPTTAREAAAYAEREADLDDIGAEIKRLQNLQKLEAENGQKELPKGPLFSDMASDPEYQAQQKRMDRVEADRKWMNLAEESRNRKLTDEERAALKSPIEYIKHVTSREGIKVGASGERALLGAKESGIVGLVNKSSQFTTADAAVMLDEGGFTMPDGRRFTDGSVTENDVIDYLINQGKTATSEAADLDDKIAADEAAYYAKKQADEEAGYDRVPPEEQANEQQPNIDAELAEFDDYGGSEKTGSRNSRTSNGQLDAESQRNIGGDEGSKLGGTAPENVGASPFVRLRDANAERINRLREVTVGSDDGRALVRELYDYAKANGIEARHVDALVNDLINAEFARAQEADRNARQILGDAKYTEYAERIENAHEDFDRLADRIIRGFETPQVERQFIQAAKAAGFTFAEAQAILRRARAIARAAQESAKSAKERVDARRARGRRAKWQAENERLNRTYGGKFLDDSGYEVNVRFASRTGRNQVVVELLNDEGFVFDWFVTTESYLDAGLLGRMGLAAPAKLDNLKAKDDYDLSRAVSELNQLLAHSYEELREKRLANDLRAVEAINQVIIPKLQDSLVEGRAEMIRRGLLKDASEEKRKAEGDFTKQTLRDQFYADLERKRAEIDLAAHEAATSPHNDRTEPTDGQKEAGNYAKGHVRVHGLDISIENPKGSTRSGQDSSGEKWSVDMTAHYGYIKRTEGADGEQVDVYIGDHPESEKVFVVDQVHANTGKFDEHKVILNAPDRASAEAIYDAHFNDGRGPERRAAVTEMSLAEFKAWLKNEDNTKPVAELATDNRQPTTEKSIADIVDEEFDALFGAPKEESPALKPVLYNAERHVGDIKDGPTLGVWLAPDEKVAGKFAAGKGKIRAYEVTIKKPLRLTPDENADFGMDFSSAAHVNKQLADAGVNYRFDDYEDQELWRYFDDGGKKFINAVKKAGYDAIAYTDAIGGKTFDSTLVFDRGQLKEVPATKDKPAPPKQPRTTTEAAGSAVKNTAKGLDNIAKGLSELFGGPKLSSGLTFDEETYKAAKPYFLAAMEHFKEAAGDVREVARRLLMSLSREYQFPVEAIARMKPYIVHFIEEQQASTNKSESASTPVSLADHLVERFKTGEGFKTIIEARKFAEEVTGQPYKAGTVEAKRLDELIEASAVKAVREQIVSIYRRGEEEWFDRPVSADEDSDATAEDIGFKERRDMLWINQPTQQVLEVAFQAAQQRGAKAWTGATLDAESARNLAGFLRFTARQGGFNPIAAARMDALAGAIESLAARGPVAFAVPAKGIGVARATRRQETFHQWQLRTGQGSIDLAAPDWFRRQPLAQKILSKLREHYDTVELQKPGVAEAEAAAHIAGGEWARVGLTFDEAVNWLDGYFSQVVKRHGAEALQDLTPMHPAVQREFEKVKDLYGSPVSQSGRNTGSSTTVPGEPETGQLYRAERGADGGDASGVRQGDEGAGAASGAQEAAAAVASSEAAKSEEVAAPRKMRRAQAGEGGFLNFQSKPRPAAPIPATFNPAKFSQQVVAAINSLQNLKPAKKQAALDAYNAAMNAVAANDGAALKKAQIELKDSLGKFGIGLLDITRPMMAGGELSIIGRQGGYHFLSHPILSGRALKTAFQSVSEQGYHQTLAELEAHPYFEKAKKAGVDFGVTSEYEIGKSTLAGEENFSVGLAGKIPGLKHLERINKAFLDMQRMNVFAYGAEMIEKAGGSPEQIDSGLKEWAKEVNRASGRANISEKYQSAVNVASTGLFSPRFAISRLQLMDPTRFVRAWRKNPAAAKMMLADGVKMLGTVSALAGLAFLSGASVGSDPDDADFLKVKFGNVHLSLLPFGLSSYVKLAARMAKRAVNYYESGDNREIKYGAKQLASFARTKLAPLPGLAVDQLMQEREKGEVDTIGHDAIGQPKALTGLSREKSLGQNVHDFLLESSVGNRLWPMFYQNVAETVMREGLFNAVVKNAPEFIGADSQVYDQKERVGRSPMDDKDPKNLTYPEKRAARKEVHDRISQTELYKQLPDIYRSELMEKQMDEALTDASRRKDKLPPASSMYKRLSLQLDGKVVSGLQKLHELPEIKVMSKEQKKAAEAAYNDSLRHLRGRREGKETEESLPELPDPRDLRDAMRAAIKAAKQLPAK